LLWLFPFCGWTKFTLRLDNLNYQLHLITKQFLVDWAHQAKLLVEQLYVARTKRKVEVDLLFLAGFKLEINWYFLSSGYVK